MKTSFTILFISSLFILSCSKSNILIDESSLIGEWRSLETKVNDQALADFGVTDFPYILVFRDLDFYFLDYNSGSWDLIDNDLMLNDIEGNSFRNYKILEVTENTIRIEAEILGSQLYFNLSGIEDNEKIIINQLFERQ